MLKKITIKSNVSWKDNTYELETKWAANMVNMDV